MGEPDYASLFSPGSRDSEFNKLIFFLHEHLEVQPEPICDNDNLPVRNLLDDAGGGEGLNQ